MSKSAAAAKKGKKGGEKPPSPSASSQRSSSTGERDSEVRQSSLSDESSAISSPRRRNERPRFDSKASWADSTRFDMGRVDSRASDISSRDLRLTMMSKSHHSNGRHRSDSRASRMSRASSRASIAGGNNTSGGIRGRNSSFVSNFGVQKGRKDSNALSTITENWNLADDQFGSPFADFDAQGTEDSVVLA